MTLLVLLAALALALSNGANDNFKGVATLYGSGTTSYRVALAWATFTTLAGSLVATAFAASLIKTFSGSGLVAPVTAASPTFLAAVAIGAAASVLLATRMGMPVSTTHALTGALVGAGFVAVGSAVDLRVLGAKFVAPLVFSPVVALVAARVAYPLAHAVRVRLGIGRTSCICVESEWIPIDVGGSASLATPAIWIGTAPACAERYDGTIVGITAQHALDALHFVSAGAMSFARGLNDTPKIVAVLIAAGALKHASSSTATGLAIAAGGVLGARRVAETVSHRISTIPAGQGLVANVVTALLVGLATSAGLPVSTTHVATGTIIGIGMTNGTTRWRMIGRIFVAWVTTLPVAAIIAAICYATLSRR